MPVARTPIPCMLVGSHITLLLDVSRHTLLLRRALRSLLTVLKDRNINYHWGVPMIFFFLQDYPSSSLIHNYLPVNILALWIIIKLLTYMSSLLGVLMVTSYQ